jgi:hypothetical protein
VTDHLLELSTAVDEAKTFTVDGETYKLLSFDHLSAEDESKAMGDSARFEQLMNKMSRAGTDAEARRLANQVRNKRIDILTRLTTMPRDVAERLPLQAQVKLFQAVQTESLDGEDSGD